MSEKFKVRRMKAADPPEVLQGLLDKALEKGDTVVSVVAHGRYVSVVCWGEEEKPEPLGVAESDKPGEEDENGDSGLQSQGGPAGEGSEGGANSQSPAASGGNPLGI